VTPADDRDDDPGRRWRCRGWADPTGPCMDPRCDACCPQAETTETETETEEEP
jgi:hypothetical protein